MRQKFFVSALLCCVPFILLAQSKTGIVKGILINAATNTPFGNLKVTLIDLNVVTTSDRGGRFTLSNIPYGDHNMVINGSGAKSDTISVSVNKVFTDLKTISVATSEGTYTPDNSDIPTIAINDNNVDVIEGDISSQGTSDFLGAAEDPFLYNIMGLYYNYRYKPRGMFTGETEINGVPLIDYERGFSTFGQLGGLYDVLRNHTWTYGLKPSDYGYGGTYGMGYISATAADQVKGTTVSYQNTNRNYRNRVMATYNTGLMANGWAYSFSASRRWAEEGYVKGTFYDGYSFYGGASKKIGKGILSLTAIGAPTTYGRGSYAETQEVYDITHDNQYNPYWGYQNGKKRNARVVNTFQPLIIANYTYRPSDKLRWNTAVGYSFGKYNSSFIDEYNAASPYPDYYRNFPSYYLTFRPPYTALAQQVKDDLLAHPEKLQIQWDDLYNANYNNVQTLYNVNGVTGNNLTGRRSLYVLSNYVDDMKKLNINTNFEYNKNDHVNLYAGLHLTSQTDEYYKQLTDLLGGDYFVNYNQFAAQQTIAYPGAIQNNLNTPNQAIKVGDRYGFDYAETIRTGDVWGQATANYNKLELFAAIAPGITAFDREGFMRNGLFPNNSFGKSATQSFFTYKVKGGLTYRLDLHNSLYASGEYRTEAPTVANTYISVSTRDYTVANPQVLKSKSFEAGYLRTSRLFNARITGYVTDITDATQILRFYNDDPDVQSFVNYVMTNVGIRSIGAEAMGSYKINGLLTATGIATIGQTFYTTNPTATYYQDNDPTLAPSSHKVYIRNYYVGNGPQSVYSFSLSYRPKNWNLHLTATYMDENYVSINPDRRTTLAGDTLQRGTAAWHKVYDQEKLPGAFVMDLHGGKSFNIGKHFKRLQHHYTSLYLSFGINNLLNNKNIIRTGYEQLRYDYAGRSPERFANKYDYAYGLGYQVSLSLRF